MDFNGSDKEIEQKVSEQYKILKEQLRYDNLIGILSNKKRHLNNTINNKRVFKNQDFLVDSEKFDEIIQKLDP